MKILKSALDSSVNFVFDSGVECRFVQRSAEYFIIYVSSHNGCNKACRFCHLTQLKQTDYDSTHFSGYVEQVRTVLDYWKNNIYKGIDPVKVHVNFMARGEPLDNPVVRNMWGHLSTTIDKMIKEATGVSEVRFKISTILPKTIEDKQALVANFNRGVKPDIYYYMYSQDKDFRKQWIPKAMPLSESLELIKEFMNNSIRVTFHHALIKHENSNLTDAKEFVSVLRQHDIVGARFNLVRYNPHSSVQGEEASDKQIMNYLSVLTDSGIFSNIKTIPKVGLDIAAACGMFIQTK